MPEGDTIHKLARILAPRLTGAAVVHSRLRHHQGDPLAGRRIVGVDALGKHLFIRFEGGLSLRTHLGLYGSWHGYAPAEPWQKPERRASVVLGLPEAVFVCFNAREVQILREGGGVRERELAKVLGPDLLSPRPDFAAMVRRARTTLPPETPLMDMLLDQRVAAGIGNIYKSELLFILHLLPQRQLESIGDGVIESLYRRASALLRYNLASGPRTTRFAADGLGRLWVYGRGGAPCLICRQALAAAKCGRDRRVTFWCPSCQK